MIVFNEWDIGGYAQLEATRTNRKCCKIELDLDRDINVRLSWNDEERSCNEILDFVKSQKETTSEQKALLDENAKENLYNASVNAIDMFFTNSLKAANIDGLIGVDKNLNEIIYDFEKTNTSLIKKVFIEASDKINALNNKLVCYRGVDFLNDVKIYKPCETVETVDRYGNRWELGDIIIYCQTNQPSIICKLTNTKVMLSEGSLVDKASCLLVKKNNGTPVKFGTIFG